MADEAKSCDFALPLPTRETFKDASPDMKSMYLFDLMCIALENQNAVRTYIENEKVEKAKAKKITIGLSSGAGAGASLLIVGLKYLFGIHN